VQLAQGFIQPRRGGAGADPHAEAKQLLEALAKGATAPGDARGSGGAGTDRGSDGTSLTRPWACDNERTVIANSAEARRAERSRAPMSEYPQSDTS